VADQALDAATRDATPITVALADIDGLHAINMNLGLAAGDQYITAVARRLSRTVPTGGCLVRQGGDEFTLLAPHLAPDEVATAIGAAMAGPAVIAGYRIQPRASVGIAASGGDARYARACADAAMYTAKAAGGNHIMVYQPDRDGQPEPDGTRPLIRRRDLNPPGPDVLAWQPTPGDDLLPLLLSVDEARTVHQVLCAARDRWAGSRAEAQAGTHNDAGAHNDQAPPATRSEHISPEHISPEHISPEHINVEPTPAGYRAIARIADREQAATPGSPTASPRSSRRPSSSTPPPTRRARPSASPATCWSASAPRSPRSRSRGWSAPRPRSTANRTIAATGSASWPRVPTPCCAKRWRRWTTDPANRDR